MGLDQIVYTPEEKERQRKAASQLVRSMSYTDLLTSQNPLWNVVAKIQAMTPEEYKQFLEDSETARKADRVAAAAYEKEQARLINRIKRGYAEMVRRFSNAWKSLKGEEWWD